MSATVKLELVRKNLALMALTVLSTDELEEAAFNAIHNCLEMFGMENICTACNGTDGWFYLPENKLPALEEEYGVKIGDRPDEW